MSSTRHALAVSALLATSCVAACGNKDAATADSSRATAAPSASAKTPASAKPTASASASSAAAATPQGHPWINETGRGGAKCEFTKWGENYEKKKIAMFKLSGPPGKEVDNLQTWEFYYAKDGKQLDSYPHSTFIDADKPEQGLGQSGDKIPKETATVECEITRISFKDKTFWFNGNLVPLAHNRPKGGIPDDALKASSGEKVTVEILDAKKGHVKLKNVSDKEVKSVEVDIIYFKSDGTHEYKTDFSVDAALKPGESAEKDVKLGDDKLPEFSSAEAYAPQVHFGDDSSWENRNLSGFELPN